MAHTRIVTIGDDQMVLIPPEFAYAEKNLELKITRYADVITIFPVHSSMADVVETLRRMPKPPRVEKRRAIEVPARHRRHQ